MASTKSLNYSVGVLKSNEMSGGLDQLRRSDLLINTMSYTAPKKEMVVPNHLLKSKMYNKLGQNGLIEARPSVLHFAGFELGKKQEIPLCIGNMDTEVIRMHIIPPQTKYFSINYTKGERLVPGLTLDCTVEFIADEWRYYYDCIRIHTKGNDNLIIPIHAYPVMNLSDFPTQINFPTVPVGQRMQRKIPLKCDVPVDFEFSLSVIQPHSAFSVEPMEGVVPANGETEIIVTFIPSEFLTARMQIQINISQFNSKPLICTCLGNSAPGLAKKLSEQKQITMTNEQDTILDPVAISPIDRARKKRLVKRTKVGETTMQPTNIIQETEVEGIRFPNNLDTTYAVGAVLNQKPGKLRMKDLQEAIEAKKDAKVEGRQLKETLFEQAARKDAYDERQNQLRWQVKVGSDPVSDEHRHDVITDRNESWETYRIKRGDPLPASEQKRLKLGLMFRRTIRKSDNLGEEGIQFDTFVNDPWAIRQAVKDRFAQAARTILVRRRADKKIRGLQTLVMDWSKKSKASSPGLDEDEESEEGINRLINNLESPKVKHFRFPTYTSPNVKDDMAPDAMDAVPIEPTDVVIKKKVPYHQLKVPQQYNLLKYTYHNVHAASSGYVPPKLTRQLRKGAEDEIISLPESAVGPIPEEMKATEVLEVSEGDLVIKEFESKTPEIQDLSLEPPKTFFEPIKYPPMHIFNPTPGLQVFQAPLPYAEFDQDFHLCPVPRYPTKDVKLTQHTTTQKKYLDRKDVIKGVMAWKKFPSQGLTSLANTPTLTNVWVPRWTDPFGDDMIPSDVPDLHDALPVDDQENVIDADDEETKTQTEAVSLTPDMVNAQFSQIKSSSMVEDDKAHAADMFPHGSKMPATNIPVSSNGPVPREKREQELDYFLNKKYNKLGTKVQQRINSMNTVTVKKDLVLK